ncbi:MAG: hypothetical protein Q7R95_10345, partial [bacterium]|nr:hypothetical protein [bacterium]
IFHTNISQFSYTPHKFLETPCPQLFPLIYNNIMMYALRHKLPKFVNDINNLPILNYQNQFQKLISGNKIMSTLWPMLSTDFQQKLLYSFTYRQIYNQVLNIKIDNWHELSFVESEFNRLIKMYSIQKYRVMGNHRENIRFGNIHFATDIIDGETVYQIHWDKYCPSSLIKLIKHNIFD